jgi:hypothetical protein
VDALFQLVEVPGKAADIDDAQQELYRNRRDKGKLHRRCAVLVAEKGGTARHTPITAALDLAVSR